MRKAISAHIITLFCIIFAAGMAVEASAGMVGGNFKVRNRGVKEYLVDVPPNSKGIYVTIDNMSQHLGVDIFRPDAQKASCHNSTWGDGFKVPLKCSLSRPEPGRYKIRITGQVHVGSLDKIPYVTGRLTVSTPGGQPGLTGQGVRKPAGQTGGSGSEAGNFRIRNRGVKEYTVDVPPNTKKLYVTVKNMSQHLGVDIFEPDAQKASCHNTTWSGSFKRPLTCSLNMPKPGKYKIRITGQVHVGSLDEIPYVTGEMVVKLVGGQAKTPGTPAPDDEAPPGHPEVEIPGGPAGRTARVPEAGTWFPSATTLEYDSRLKGYIKRGDYDMYTFYFPGGNLRAYSRGNLDLVAELLNDKQERLARDRSSGSGNNFMFQGNYPAGLYYIQIRVMYHGGQGPYELILGNGRDWSFEEKN